MAILTRAARTSIAFAFFAALAPLAGQAQSWTRPGEETMSFNLGGVRSRIDASARLDGNRGGIDLEVDAGKNGFKGNAQFKSSKATLYLTGRF